jgi:hypothetical protein
LSTSSALTVAGGAAGYDGGVAALLIAAMLIAIPLLGTMYVAARHGVGKVPLWFKLHLSHSNPNVACFYLPTEERCAMRQKLCGRNSRGSLAPTQAATDEEFGSRRRQGPLMPTPKGSAPPAAIVTAQAWLEKAENAAVSCSSY